MNAQTAMLNQQLLDMKTAAQERGTWEEQKKQIRNKEGAEYDRLVALYKADKTAFNRKLEELSIKEKWKSDISALWNKIFQILYWSKLPNSYRKHAEYAK